MFQKTEYLKKTKQDIEKLKTPKFVCMEILFFFAFKIGSTVFRRSGTLRLYCCYNGRKKILAVNDEYSEDT